MVRMALRGLGHCLPPQIVETGEVAGWVGQSAAELVALTGVRRRYFAGDGVGPSVLAEAAARTALEEAGCSAADIDLIIFATITPDITFPGAGCLLQAQLECGTAGALDVRAQCAGFLAALVMADHFVRSGFARTVLVAAAEVHSSGLDFSNDRGLVSAYFGDGGAAAVVGPTDRPAGVRASVLHCDGRGADVFWCEYPSSLRYPIRVTVDDLRAGRHYPTIRFEEMHEFARAQLPRAIEAVLAQAGVERCEVDHFILHYIDPNVAHEIAERCGLGLDRVTVPAVDLGHVAAAGPLIALDRARRAGRVGPGNRVCLAACGSGFAWGATLIDL